MKTDPLKGMTFGTIRLPTNKAGKMAWIDIAYQLVEANQRLSGIIDDQRAVVSDRDAEIALLKQQVAERKPAGGRPSLPEHQVEYIEAELARGVGERAIAKAVGVTQMTVNRYRRRMLARQRSITKQ